MLSVSKGDTYRIWVDVESTPLLQKYTWGIDSGGYVYTNVGGRGNVKKVYLHRFLMKAPSDLKVDHIDHNRLNNTLLNLRLCTSSGNNRNQKVRSGLSSKFKGVSYSKKENRWYAYITVDNKKKHIGIFDKEEEAAKAYNVKAQEIFGEFACLNEV